MSTKQRTLSYGLTALDFGGDISAAAPGTPDGDTRKQLKVTAYGLGRRSSRHLLHDAVNRVLATVKETELL
jgi:hypothetical protein